MRLMDLMIGDKFKFKEEYCKRNQFNRDIYNVICEICEMYLEEESYNYFWFNTGSRIYRWKFREEDDIENNLPIEIIELDEKN